MVEKGSSKMFRCLLVVAALTFMGVSPSLSQQTLHCVFGIFPPPQFIIDIGMPDASTFDENANLNSPVVPPLTATYSLSRLEARRGEKYRFTLNREGVFIVKSWNKIEMIVYFREVVTGGLLSTVELIDAKQDDPAILDGKCELAVPIS